MKNRCAVIRIQCFSTVFLQSSYPLFLNCLASVWDGMYAVTIFHAWTVSKESERFHEELSLKLVWLATGKYLECLPKGGRSSSPCELVPLWRQLNRALVSRGLCWYSGTVDASEYNCHFSAVPPLAVGARSVWVWARSLQRLWSSTFLLLGVWVSDCYWGLVFK